MERLYRYSNETIAMNLMERGEVCFHALSFFRKLEDGGKRGDPHDGAYVYHPPGGITMLMEGKPVAIPPDMRFESRAAQDNVFIYCLSTKLDEVIAERFGAVCCVEILDRRPFISSIQYALKKHPFSWAAQFINKPVEYYQKEHEPKNRWALPDLLAFCKSESEYAWQSEYRIVFAIKDAFDFERGDYIITNEAPKPDSRTEFPKHLVALGDLRKSCRLHRF